MSEPSGSVGPTKGEAAAVAISAARIKELIEDPSEELPPLRPEQARELAGILALKRPPAGVS